MLVRMASGGVIKISIFQVESPKVESMLAKWYNLVDIFHIYRLINSVSIFDQGRVLFSRIVEHYYQDEQRN